MLETFDNEVFLIEKTRKSSCNRNNQTFLLKRKKQIFSQQDLDAYILVLRYFYDIQCKY